MEKCTIVRWEGNTKRLNLDRVQVHDKLVSVIKNTISSGKILEIGAESGSDAQHLASSGFDVTTIDYSREAIKLLKYRKGIKVVEANAFKLPFKDHTFDLVYSQGLMEHYRGLELNVLMEEQKRVVRPKGYILIDVPNTYSTYTARKQILMAMNKWRVGWETQYTYKQLCELGKKRGLKLVEEYAWGYNGRI